MLLDTNKGHYCNK